MTTPKKGKFFFANPTRKKDFFFGMFVIDRINLKMITV